MKLFAAKLPDGRIVDVHDVDAPPGAMLRDELPDGAVTVDDEGRFIGGPGNTARGCVIAIAATLVLACAGIFGATQC